MTIDQVHCREVRSLTWDELDPAARPAVDLTDVAAVLRELPPVAEMPAAGADWRLTEFWYDRLTAAMAERLGDWVVGWGCTVAMEEHPKYGVIPSWKEVRPPATTPAETLSRVADAVVAWHELLVELASDTRGRLAASPAWTTVVTLPLMSLSSGSRERRVPHPTTLSWAEVDPAGRTFDAATVPAVAAELVAAAEIPSPGADWRLRDLWLEDVTVGLVERYGSWAIGWRWSIGEADVDGGPVGSWCCFHDSVSTPDATAVKVAASLVEWHDWLTDNAERFGRFLPMPTGDLDDWERAVAHLVTAVGDRTQYESAWYDCCRTVLGWFLEAAGIEADRRVSLLKHAIGGRFESWVEPKRAVVETVAERVAGGLA